MDVYFSADVETDGPIPGVFSILSFGLAFAGRFDGVDYQRPREPQTFYRELKPISEKYQLEALRVNGLDRGRLILEGQSPENAMTEAARWVRRIAGAGSPVIVAYPLSFDWSFLYWYFIRFSAEGSPFGHSRCFDIKTAFAVKANLPVCEAGRSNMFPSLSPGRVHTHNALDDALEQAEIFANLFEWSGVYGRITS